MHKVNDILENDTSDLCFWQRDLTIVPIVESGALFGAAAFVGLGFSSICMRG